MSGDRRVEGCAAEDAAVQFVITRGWTVLHRRYKARSGEIDIVALDRDCLVFAEVKSTKQRDIDPVAAVGVQKQKRMVQAATQYIAEHGLNPTEVRYDIIAITPSGFKLHEAAFTAS
jgi:putative endonuclease